MHDNEKALIDIAKKLGEIYSDKDFLIEILKRLQEHEELIELFYNRIKDCPAMVASEIYDILHLLTNGTFKKEFPKIRESKMRYLECENEENKNLFLESLQTANLYLPCIWKLTEEEEEKFNMANVGDSVHIDSPCFPVVLNGEKGLVLPVFTSGYEIPQVCRRKYTIQNCTWNIVKKWYMVLEDHIDGEIKIAIDLASDACLLIQSLDKDFLK